MEASETSHDNTPTTNTLRLRKANHSERVQEESKDSSQEETSKSGASVFDCHICFDTPTDPVVTPCGHLYCWSCIYRWMKAHPEGAGCPVCKSSIDKSKIIPIYGRGGNDQEDPRNKTPNDAEEIPARPMGQRTEFTPRQSSNTSNPLQGGGAPFGGPFYSNPFYPGPFPSAVHHGNFGPFSVSAFGPFPSLFGLQFTYPPPQSSQEPLTEEQANQAFVSRLLLVMGLLIILCLLFV
eukprot:jgi/Galph1/245/GphlegSOOS_G4903.1